MLRLRCSEYPKRLRRLGTQVSLLSIFGYSEHVGTHVKYSRHHKILTHGGLSILRYSIHFNVWAFVDTQWCLSTLGIGMYSDI